MRVGRCNGITTNELIHVGSCDVSIRILLQKPSQRRVICLPLVVVINADVHIESHSLKQINPAIGAASCGAVAFDAAIRIQHRHVTIGIISVPLDDIARGVGQAGHIVIRILLDIQPLVRRGCIKSFQRDDAIAAVINIFTDQNHVAAGLNLHANRKDDRRAIGHAVCGASAERADDAAGTIQFRQMQITIQPASTQQNVAIAGHMHTNRQRPGLTDGHQA